jgi:hypothetical protein
MSDPASEASLKKVKLSKEEIDFLLEKYDKDHSGSLSDEEIESIVRDFNSKDKNSMDKRLISIIELYDFDSSGTLDDEEVKVLKHEFKSTGTVQRVAGYSAVMTRAFRYLAFTSDFGEALRPVISARLVNASYAVAGGYCVADVAWEAYKLKQRNYRTESGQPMSMPQLVVERSSFQVKSCASCSLYLISRQEIILFYSHLGSSFYCYTIWRNSHYCGCFQKNYQEDWQISEVGTFYCRLVKFYDRKILLLS